MSMFQRPSDDLSEEDIAALKAWYETLDLSAGGAIVNLDNIPENIQRILQAGQRAHPPLPPQKMVYERWLGLRDYHNEEVYNFLLDMLKTDPDEALFDLFNTAFQMGWCEGIERAMAMSTDIMANMIAPSRDGE